MTLFFLWSRRRAGVLLARVAGRYPQAVLHSTVEWAGVWFAERRVGVLGAF